MSGSRSSATDGEVWVRADPAAETRLVAGALQVSSVSDAVYGRLRSRILAGMPPGQPLRPIELGAEMGVSTTPVRAAIARLVGDGLVVQEGRKGARVAPLSISDLRDIYSVRRALEGSAARLGAPTLGATDLEQMTTLMGDIDGTANTKNVDVERYLRTEWQMHIVCYRATKHERLVQEIQSYRRQAERYFRIALMEGLNVPEDLERQRSFFSACAKRDGRLAEATAHDLLDWTVDRVAPLLGQLPLIAAAEVE